MQTTFENWLKEKAKMKESTAYNYAKAINRISRHFQENEKQKLNLYRITNLQELGKYVEMYNKDGKYSDFGDKGNGTNRAAINKYKEFISNGEFLSELTPKKEEKSYFSYEKDLQNSILYEIQTGNLFRGYELVEEEFVIEGKKNRYFIKKR